MHTLVDKLYQAREFAEASGVTVRTLHHYDRIGLLKPSHRTEAGYRLYGKADFMRLQQIVTLKFIGFSLKQIKEVLDRRSMSLGQLLRMQREAIQQKREQLEDVLAAIRRAEWVVERGEEPEWDTLRKIVEVIEMQQNTEWMKKYYTPEQLKLMESRYDYTGGQERAWAQLLKEVDEAIARGEDPSSAKSQELAQRWSDLINQFTGGDPAVSENLRKMYADQANWPSTFQKPFSDEACAFIGKARSARQK